MNGVGRRTFVSVAAVLSTARAIPQARAATKARRIGVLAVGSPDLLRRALNELGYVEGRDFVLETRNPEGKVEGFDELARELVALRVDVIVAPNPAAVLSAKRATKSIPIVMMHTPDPVELGLVASLAKPGGNVTGVTTLSADLSIKQLQLVKEALAGVTRVGLLWNPESPWHPATVKVLGARSGPLGISLQMLEVRDAGGFDGAFAAMTRERTQAVLVLADPMNYFHRERLAGLAIEHRLAMMAGLADYAEAGSLLSYWASTVDVYRRTASYIDRILKGAKASDLPIEQPTNFEFVVNLKTAQILGVTIPRSVLLQATRVIE
jgi:putative ABC transport system substrate-binding protein